MVALKQLDAEELLNEAKRRTGLSDFGPDDFREGFFLVIAGINKDAHIRDSGWTPARERFLRMLMNRLWFAKDLADHPEIMDEQVDAPVFITSLPRTGSTKLQRVLGASGGFQTPSYWMGLMFARIPGLEDGGRARRIAETREFEKWMYETSPAMLLGHPMFTDEPEEDLWLLECSFRHPIHSGAFHLPDYGQWLAQTDWMPAFQYLAAQTKYLHWQLGSQHDKPWLAKTPSHFGFEPLLCATNKNPRFIVTHRDPVKCIPSIILTSMAQRGLYSDYDSISMLGPDLLRMFSAAADAHMQWRDANPDVEILDLRFRDVATDGINTVRRVYDFLGLPFTVAAKQGILKWERDNPKDKHGKAEYSAATMGTTDEDILRVFSAYRERFASYF